jgi:predicted ester cyclase
MVPDDVRAVVTAALQRFNDRDDRLGFLDAYAPDVRLHGYPGGLAGREGLERFHAPLWDAFPDAALVPEDVVVEGDRAAVRYRLTATHEGPYMGVAPKRARVDVQGIMVVRVAGGLVVEEWHSPTELSILRQLGAIEVHLAGTRSRRPGAGPRRSAAAEAAALRWQEAHDG